jgi:hypothetical protein
LFWLQYAARAQVQDGFTGSCTDHRELVEESPSTTVLIMSEFLKSLDPNTMEFLKFALPLAGAIIAWFFNEQKKRAWDEYQRKESNYKELMLALKGFYASKDDPEGKQLKNKFIDQLNLCWLYSPDNVISAGYQFIRTVRNGDEASDERKQEALGFFILAIREDLISRRITRVTKLESKDFMLLTSS